MKLGWKHHYSLQEGIADIVYWYKHNQDWLEQNRSKNQEWLKEQYG